MDDNKTRIKILERSFDIMEEVIIKGFVEDDEKKTRKNFATILAEKRKSLVTEVDQKALQEVDYKLGNLTYIEISEIYDIINAD